MTRTALFLFFRLAIVSASLTTHVLIVLLCSDVWFEMVLVCFIFLVRSFTLIDHLGIIRCDARRFILIFLLIHSLVEGSSGSGKRNFKLVPDLFLEVLSVHELIKFLLCFWDKSQSRILSVFDQVLRSVDILFPFVYFFKHLPNLVVNFFHVLQTHLIRLKLIFANVLVFLLAEQMRERISSSLRLTQVAAYELRRS